MQITSFSDMKSGLIALGRIKDMIEDKMSAKSNEQNEISEKKLIHLNAISILLNSDDMRLGQVIYDLEENIAFGQEEIDCTDIPECYEDMLPDDVEKKKKKDWFWDYVDEHPERFISVNIDYNGYDTMVGFIRTIDDNKISNKLANAIRGKGAFKRFRYVAEENGLLQKWYDFKNAAEENTIREWCKDNGYECVAS